MYYIYIYLFIYYYLLVSFRALTLLVLYTMSIKEKMTKPLGFPVVLCHYRLTGTGRKGIRLIKINWLFQ